MLHGQIHDHIHKLIQSNALTVALSGDVAIHLSDADSTAIESLREDMGGCLGMLGLRYIYFDYSEDMYYEEAEKLAAYVNKHHSDTLGLGGITLGVAQLCIGSYLKGRWLCGDPTKMPFLPPISDELLNFLKVQPDTIQLLETRPQIHLAVEAANKRAFSAGYRSGTIWEAESGWERGPWYE